jgi:hypothetical protein
MGYLIGETTKEEREQLLNLTSAILTAICRDLLRWIILMEKRT